MDNRIINNEQQKFDLMFWQKALRLNTAIPAIVDEFDAANQTVSATPAIKAKFITLEQKVEYIPYPKITNIPLAIQRGNGLIITYPLKKGDVCTLIFSQRSIDNFIETGEISNPFDGPDNLTSTIRCHDMSDAMCFPGIITNNKIISDYSDEAVEIRSEDGTTKISISENDLKFIQGGAMINLSGGNVSITGGTVTINGKDWNTHAHTGVQTGGSNTGGVA